MSKTDFSETEVRDRIGLLVSYLQALIASATDNFETAQDSNDRNEARRASNNALTSLAIAGEYLDEISRLEDRPTSEMQTAA